MRRIHTTTVNVQVNDRNDRTNVVATLVHSLQRMRLFVREMACCACKSLGEFLLTSESSLRWQAKYAACPVSPSWGGLRPSGGPGTAISS
ncbi:MAG: hypothetical protein AB7O38_13735 [Pirellulaceae bacterium]